MNKSKLRFLYICPVCGNVILKSKEYKEEEATIKCQKCGKIFWINNLPMKRLALDKV